MKNKQDLTRLMNTRNASRGNEYAVLVETFVADLRSAPNDISDVYFRLSRWDDACRRFIMHDIRNDVAGDAPEVQSAVQLLAEKLCID
ncbi:MAG: hypothetical protein IJ242_11015 [Clostridia bacterium]|nr:hypothetical protein [Clostridia bacterium]